MRKTVLPAVLSLTLLSLSACQTARIQPAQSTDALPERTIAQAPAETALEAVFKTLANTAGADQETFDAKVFELVSAKPEQFGLASGTKITSMSELKEQVGNDPEGFFRKFHKSDALSLNVKPNAFTTAVNDQFKNVEASTTGVKTIGLSDLSRPAKTVGPVTADSFKDAVAAGASPTDVATIVNAERDLESKGHTLVKGGCARLRSPASVSTLAKVVSETDAEVIAKDTKEIVDGKFVENLGKETGDVEGACDRARALADPNECGVVDKISPKVCAE